MVYVVKNVFCQDHFYFQKTLQSSYKQRMYDLEVKLNFQRDVSGKQIRLFIRSPSLHFLQTLLF